MKSFHVCSESYIINCDGVYHFLQWLDASMNCFGIATADILSLDEFTLSKALHLAFQAVINGLFVSLEVVKILWSPMCFIRFTQQLVNA